MYIVCENSIIIWIASTLSITMGTLNEQKISILKQRRLKGDLIQVCKSMKDLDRHKMKPFFHLIMKLKVRMQISVNWWKN